MATYRVLIVDDQRDIRFLVSSALKTLGVKMEVVDVPSAEEALLIANRPFDLVVTDVNLPGISGIDLVKRIRKRSPEIKIIVVTGVSDNKDRKQVEELGTNYVLYKPLDIKEFLIAARQCLGLTAAEPTPAALETARTQTIAEETRPTIVVIEQPPIAAPEPLPAPAITRESILAELRLKVNADAAVLIEEGGNVLAQEGEFTELAQSELVTALSSAFGLMAQISQHLHMGVPDGYLCFSGAGRHLCLVPASQAHFFLLVGAQPWQTVELTYLHISDAVTAYQRFLAEEQLEAEAALFLPTEAMVDMKVSADDLAAVDALFNLQKAKSLKGKDLDAFWDAAADKSG